MQEVTLFAMTQKGHAVVETLATKFPSLVSAVVSARDPGIAKDYYSEIQDLCRRSNIPFHDRTEFFSIRTKYAIAVSWRWIIECGSSALVVFHDSLLPRYRGFNPLVTALINGDETVGVTALFATHQYDRGDIVAQSSSSLVYPITIKRAIETTLENYEALALLLGKNIAEGRELKGTPQADAEATYSLWRDEEDYFVDWNASASRIRRFVDAVGYPYKRAAARLDGRIVRIVQSETMEDVPIINRTPGKVIFIVDSKPVVVCGDGLLKITDLVDDETRASLLPLCRFRMRFK